MKANYMLWAKSLNLPPIALQADRDEVDTSKKDDFLSVELTAGVNFLKTGVEMPKGWYTN